MTKIIMKVMIMETNIEVTDYIDTAPEPQKQILLKLRELISTAVPNSIEQFKWRQPTYATEKDYCYLKYTKDHVNLGFTDLGKIDDPNSLLEGTGKKMCHIKLNTIEDANQIVLGTMIKQA